MPRSRGPNAVAVLAGRRRHRDRRCRDEDDRAEHARRRSRRSRLLGDALRLTLVRNQGAAFGLYLGDYSRYIFMVLTVGALIILWRLYQSTRDGDMPRTLAIALVCAGALGNLIDRIRWREGVVDFIDVGFRDMRWPTFNVADMAVSTGAFLLAWVLWGDDRAERARAADAASVTGGSNAASATAGSQDAT